MHYITEQFRMICELGQTGLVRIQSSCSVTLRCRPKNYHDGGYQIHKLMTYAYVHANREHIAKGNN